jgi:GPI-anchor transamidase subunit K
MNRLLSWLAVIFTLLGGIVGSSVSDHTNNWAVLVSTSRFWFNYRHMANVLSMYRTVKRLGIPDSQIILMLSDDVSCNPRNAFPGTVYNNADRALDLYGDNIEVDFRGYEVTVENFIRLLTDRWDEDVPRSKRLLTDDRSNIFIYMTGHGGNEFLKFQDAEEIGAFDIADAFEQMWEKKRYNEIFFMIDTCQANTMYSKFYSPNILAVGSSKLDENSYSHHADQDVGVAVIDRFTYYNLEFLESIDKSSKKTMADLFNSYNADEIHSNPGIRSDLYGRSVDQVLITDFFGNIQDVEVDNVKTNVLELAKMSQDNIKVEESIDRELKFKDSTVHDQPRSSQQQLLQYTDTRRSNVDGQSLKTGIFSSDNFTLDGLQSHAGYVVLGLMTAIVTVSSYL